MKPKSNCERLAPLATVVACFALVWLVGVAIVKTTLGFQAWTFEDRRRLLLEVGDFKAPRIALIGTDARPVELWTERTKSPMVFLVDFIYTRCPTVCRSLGTEYQRMQRLLVTKPDSSVRLVSISIDDAYDGPVQLAQYASALHADAKIWTMAVPASGSASQVLLRGLGVVVVPDGQGGFVHNGAIHMLDERGRLLGLFEMGQWDEALAAARRIADGRRGATS